MEALRPPLYVVTGLPVLRDHPVTTLAEMPKVGSGPVSGCDCVGNKNHSTYVRKVRWTHLTRVALLRTQNSPESLLWICFNCSVFSTDTLHLFCGEGHVLRCPLQAQSRVPVTAVIPSGGIRSQRISVCCL